MCIFSCNSLTTKTTFAGQEMGAQRDSVTCPRLDIYSVEEVGFEPTLLAHWISPCLHTVSVPRVLSARPALTPPESSSYENLRLLENYNWKPFIMNMRTAKLLERGVLGNSSSGHFWKTRMTDTGKFYRSWHMLCKHMSSSHKENEDPWNSTPRPGAAVWAWITLLLQGKGT